LNIDRLGAILHPYIRDKHINAQKSQQRFAHYTSADAATKILKNGEVWLRKSSVMNDFSEIEFGINCLLSAWNSETGTRCKVLLSKISSTLPQEVEARFGSQIPSIRFNTFLSSISEHDQQENKLGRLSMWRAYGNVALILNPAIFFVEASNVIQCYANPVSYHTPESFHEEFNKMVDRSEYDVDYLKGLGQTVVYNGVMLLLNQYAICTKHCGFSEEREWRVLHNPSPVASPLIRKEVEVIHNVAQPVVKLKLEDRPELGVSNLNTASFVEHIIIGPTQYPAVQREAFATLLEQNGVVDPYSRIETSDIPLRQYK
jgi:hypothetical protein